MKKGALKSFLKKYGHVFRTISTAKMEFFVALLRSFQPLTNFTMKPNIVAIEVLNVPLEYYNVL